MVKVNSSRSRPKTSPVIWPDATVRINSPNKQPTPPSNNRRYIVELAISKPLPADHNSCAVCETSPVTDQPHVKKTVWAFTTYFAEGLPYTIIRTVAAVFFRDQGMSLEGLGVTSVFSLPWVLKFIWGPLLDTFGTKRQWLLITQALLCILFLVAALLTPLSQAVPLIAALFFIGSFIAATHDIAIDGFYMEALDVNDQARYLGYRVMAYRIAMMTGTGVLASVGALYGWFFAFLLGAALMTVILVVHTAILPRCEQELRPLALPSFRFMKSHAGKILSLAGLVLAARMFNQSSALANLLLEFPLLQRFTFPALVGLILLLALLALWWRRKRLQQFILENPDSFYTRSLLAFMDRKRIGFILAFIILIRAGEYMLSAMCAPFLVDLGLKSHYGWLSAGVGLPGSIAGAIFGGWCISRYSLKKMIWPFLLLQNLTNLIYMLLALKLAGFLALNTGNPLPNPLGPLNMFAVAAVHGFDQFAGGLGTAVLMTYLMRICRPQFKASHYAIGTGLMSISGLYAGVTSGFLASWLGYGYFFGLSFLLSVPGMLLVFWVPSQEQA